MNKQIIPLSQYIPEEYRSYLSLNYLLAQKIIVTTKEMADKMNLQGEREYSRIHNNHLYISRPFFSCIGRECSHFISHKD